MFNMGPQDMLIVAVIAVLLFGKRLPEVGRSLGKSIVEFKKGLRDIQGQFDSAVNTSAVNSSADHTPAKVAHHSIDDYEEATAPKFEPPAHEPTETHPAGSTGASA